mmetsp:Transcript_21267/g.43739  ORF Transcript_21267/g.43739 Transcript_21267/m.43739 type:complete len:301 (+) Transcript_21267:81-983(+)|eukprot:CAMPEP_0197263010 /NCGR_PEP_ID=MMETSP1432-20130617/865_1 /TAXON_ID=44447 /ORGANISM="Pseudo-nitzschia delicatissima, Strain UNC1205" /LENGTH=300 /DNA_ID=CAMNT_0042727403 /DNA_START=19 /DNA_END=921 /DNA_ORIENTATION=-
MAARKSCTKMTWAEAKNKCGEGGGSKNPHSAKLKLSQQPNHGKLLAAKIIAKQGSTDDRIKDRQAARMARKDQLRQEQLDAQRELEKEQKKLDSMVKPHETARHKRKEFEEQFHEKLAKNNDTTTDDSSGGDPDIVCESKQLQLDEILALEAIYSDQDVLRVSAASRMEELQEKLEAFQEDDSNATSVLEHPALSYTLARSIDHPEDDDVVAHLLLHVLYPSIYPLETTPKLDLVYCVVTKKSLLVRDNKPLESLGFLNEQGLLVAMNDEAQESLLGMPSVYELADTWLTEHFFEFIELN